MNVINYDELSYTEIITFLNAAQTLNMSMTAQAMHISQPAVSKRIANLERKFGLVLFDRTDNGLRITPAGKEMYQELLISVEHLKTAVVRAREAQANQGRILKFGYGGFFDLPLLHQIIRDFTGKQPDARVDAKSYFDTDIEDCSALFSGKADILVCPESYGYGYEEYIDKLPVSSFQFYILVSKENPLAQRNSLTPGDLVGQPLIVAHNSQNSPYLKAIRALFVPYGFSPKIGYLSSRDNLCFDIVSQAGIAIATPEFWRRMNPRSAAFFEENIVAFPIQNAHYPVSLIWRKNESDKSIRTFVDCFHELISREENATIVHHSYAGM